jgi:cysteinyl-tRNA synthetase
MPIQIYNTLTHKKEVFETLQPGKVLMYICGPTVYAKAHVGHAMSALVFDIIRRYLEHAGYEVRHVMNFTDVDDKIIQRANALKVDPYQLSQGYIDEFKHHLTQLNIQPATVNPRATEEMKNILNLISDLIEKGFAYPKEGDVYFRVRKLKDYGKLSGRKLEDMQAGSRIEVDERKEDPMDFALWKSAKPGEPAWDSPWGKGRPGWHIECSAMSMNHLGEQIDIHGGGNDLIFPHHENEIAQSEAATGKSFSRFWIHNGMLQFSGEKMSKSLGNLVTIEEFLSKHSADTLRMMVLNSGYHNPLTFNDEVIGQAESALERLRSALKSALPEVKGIAAERISKFQGEIETAKKDFESFMQDDFNTSGALSAMFNLVRMINTLRDEGASAEQLSLGQTALCELAGILGIKLVVDSQIAHPIDQYKILLVEEVQILKKSSSYENSEEFRKIIDQIEYQISINADLQLIGEKLKDVRDVSRKLKNYKDSDEIRIFSTSIGMGFEDSLGGTILIWK